MSMFQKRHYDVLAKVMAAVNPPQSEPDRWDMWLCVMHHLCQTLKEDNNRFDAERFEEAVQQLGRVPTQHSRR